MEPSDAELSAHSTRLPRREGARSALRNMGLPTVDTIDEADSSIPASSETAWTRTGTEADVSWLGATLHTNRGLTLTDGRHEAFVANGEDRGIRRRPCEFGVINR